MRPRWFHFITSATTGSLFIFVAVINCKQKVGYVGTPQKAATSSVPSASADAKVKKIIPIESSKKGKSTTGMGSIEQIEIEETLASNAPAYTIKPTEMVFSSYAPPYDPAPSMRVDEIAQNTTQYRITFFGQYFKGAVDGSVQVHGTLGQQPFQCRLPGNCQYTVTAGTKVQMLAPPSMQLLVPPCGWIDAPMTTGWICNKANADNYDQSGEVLGEVTVNSDLVCAPNYENTCYVND